MNKDGTDILKSRERKRGQKRNKHEVTLTSWQTKTAREIKR